jgi:excisionase family DNA binding protein
LSSDTLDRFRPKPTRERVVYTVQEVAHLLGLGLSGTYLLIREGTIPAIKIGGRWLVPKSRFHAWLDGIEDQVDRPDDPAHVFQLDDRRSGNPGRRGRY